LPHRLPERTHEDPSVCSASLRETAENLIYRIGNKKLIMNCVLRNMRDEMVAL
jgi:hypothetical protein